jgi:RNA polymerase sigma factor (sigma-70 family)
MADDAELLRRYSEDSDQAFTEFVGRHLNLVYFTAVRSTGGDTALAQDVAQSVFTLAARRARALSAHPTPMGWLHTTTRHIAARALRKEHTRQHYEQKAAIHSMITGASENDWERLRPVIDEALDELSAQEREAILVRFFEGRAFTDMGAGWRISQDAARMRVERALERLRRVLERRGIKSVAAALATILTTQTSLAAPEGMLAAVSGGALSAAAASGGATTFIGIMTGTKIMVGTAAAIAVLATGTALLQHNRVGAAEFRLTGVTRELVAVRAQLARSEQQRAASEFRATEAERDNGVLLAAVEAARAKAALQPPGPVQPTSSRTASPNDPLAQTLDALFPNGVVATLGNGAITVADVRRQITPLLPKVQQMGGSSEELRQRLYGLQNSAIADLVTRQLYLAEFHNDSADVPPKQIAATVIENAIADQVKEKFNNDRAMFLASLSAQGVTFEQYRQTIEEQIIYSYMRGQQRRLGSPKDGQVKPASP